MPISKLAHPKFGRARTALCASGLLSLSAAAWAQVEEIIVTAEKVESNIQQTPIAISAISGEGLESRQIGDVEALMQALPNVDFGVSLGTARLAIRGVGLDNVAGGNEGRIAFHQDGVYFSRPASVLTGFFDVDRIEVLRGPQGTLYGRNATGGVVNVMTREPGGSLNGHMNVTGGNYDLLRAEGAVGGPLSQTLSGRLAFQVEDRGGYGENETTGTDVDDKKTQAVRAKLRFEPNDSFNLTLAGDYMKEDDHANGYVFFEHSPVTAPASPLYPNPVTPQPLAGELFGGGGPRSDRNIAGDVDTDNWRRFYGFSATANLELGSLNVTSISAYRRSDLRVISDIDQTSAPIAILRQDENSKQWSEELRVQQTIGPVEWLLGGFYFEEELGTGNRLVQNSAVLPFFRTYDPNTACPAPRAPTAAVPPPQPRRACTAADLSPTYVQAFEQFGYLDTRAYALFGNVRYRFADRWGVRLGLRYSHETKAIDEQNKTDFLTPWPPYESLDPFPAPPPVLGPPNFANSYRVQDTDKSYSSVTPSATIDYEPSDTLYLYATYSKGFKSGGFNIGGAQPGFAAEKITDYELGAKADWLDRRLRTNVALFYYDYTDIQANRIDVQQLVTFNAPGAKVKGAELEIQAAPIDAISVDASASWLDTEYEGPFSTVDAARPWVGSNDLAGHQLTQAPKYTFNLGAQYAWTIGEGELTLRGETQYKDRVYFSVFNLPYVSQPAHWMSNAFLNFDSGTHWTASVFVRNVSDKLVRVAQNVGTGFWGSHLYGAYAPPRTYGVEIGYRVR